MAGIMSMHEFFYGERDSAGYNDVHYEQLHPTTFDLMGRLAAPVYGYRERAEAFGSGASSSCDDGAILTWKSSRVQQGNGDRRSYVDTRDDSVRYTRTVCPRYKESPAITHYVSVNPTMATRVESGVAWSN